MESCKRRVLISGKDGQLVTDIIKLLQNNEEYELKAYDKKQWDITHVEKSKQIFEDFKPHIYINGASYHSVEDINSNPYLAASINISALHELVLLCNKWVTTLVNFSTNYVFTLDPEEKPADEWRTPNPCNIYGIMKYAGEMIVSKAKYHRNIRVAGLFGKTGSRAKNGKNFISSICENVNNDVECNVVKDQVMNVGYTVDLAKGVMGIIDQHANGVFHLTNKESLSWYELAMFVAECKGKENLVFPCLTKDYYSNIDRPLNSAMQMTRFRLHDPMPHWRSAVVRYLREIGELV